ncbi:MAG: small multi-drug export protein [Chthoniobacterales bacterium]
MPALFIALSLGFFYFISAIPASAAAGAPLWVAAIAAWIGYSLGGLLIALLGEPVRTALTKRFQKQLDPSKNGWFQRGVRRYGLPAIGLLAPITIGPQIGALAGIALGIPKWHLTVALSLGVIPWCIGISVLLSLGFRIFGT